MLTTTSIHRSFSSKERLTADSIVQSSSRLDLVIGGTHARQYVRIYVNVELLRLPR